MNKKNSTPIKQAQETIDHLELFDERMAQSWAPRSLIEDLHDRKLHDSSINLKLLQGHTATIVMVRASLLRSFIVDTMALLDLPGNNRASIGQMMKTLASPEVQELFGRTSSKKSTDLPISISHIKRRYEEVIGDDKYRNFKELRNQKIAHTLDMDTTIPDALYEDLYFFAQLGREFVERSPQILRST